MAITDKQQSDILKVVIGLFNAAPGKVFLTDFETQVEGGTTIAQLADGLAASTQFTDGIMGGKVTTADQVAVLMNNFGVEASKVITSAGFQADFFFTARIDAGVGFGAIIFEAVTYLSGNVPLEFVATANLLTNKALVAEAYSSTSSSSDLDTLQNILKNVTSTAPFTPDDVAIIIASINDTTAPVVTTPTAHFIYAENQVGLTIATVAATDDVAVSSFKIVSGNESGFFAIDPVGRITLTTVGLTSVANDWELAPNTFTLGITAKDIAGNTSAAVNVVLEVSNVDDSAPNFGAITIVGSTAIFAFSEELSTASIPANTDFVVTTKETSAVISVTGVKIVGSTVELSLGRAPVSGETLTITYTPGQNPLTGIAGNEVAPFAGKEVILDAVVPVVVAGQTFTYVEAVAGAGPINDTADVIGKVIASDDTAITSFAITAGNDSKFFAINSKGQITLTAAGLAGAANDFETAPNSFALTVTAQDLAKNISTGQVVTITVTDNTADNGGGGGGGGGGSDTTAPTLSSSTPADNAAGIAVGANLVLTFNEAIALGTGNIVLKKTSDDSIIETFNVATGTGNVGGTVTASGTGVTINPNAGLAANTEYYVTVAATAVKDTAGNFYAGISSTTALSFTTATNAGSALTLITIGAETITGGAGDDIITGTYIDADGGTFNSTDTIDGLGGTDTLNITSNTVAITPPDTMWTNVDNIEKIVFTTTGAGAQTITTGAQFNTSFASLGVAVDLTAANVSGDITIDMATTPFTGAARITATSSGAAAHVITTGSGAATVTSTTTAGAQTINGAGLTTVTATSTGAGIQTIGNLNSGNLVTVTAIQNGAGDQNITSTSTADVTVIATQNASATAGNQIITTGAGNDTVTVTTDVAASNVIVTNGGNDTITLLATSVAGTGNTITGGAGADTITLATAFATPDTIVIGNTDSGITVATADKITNFSAATDALQMGTAGDATPGTGTYVEAGVAVADFAAALTAANTALATLAGTSAATELFSFQFDATNGYLFNDIDGNGTADQVVVLVGIDNTEISAADIIA